MPPDAAFVQSRARHLADTNKPALAAADYALAHTLFPKSRKIYIGLTGHLVATGEKLFTPDEHGHPSSLGAYLVGRYRSPSDHARTTGSSRTKRTDPLADIERINASTRRNMQHIIVSSNVQYIQARARDEVLVRI